MTATEGTALCPWDNSALSSSACELAAWRQSAWLRSKNHTGCRVARAFCHQGSHRCSSVYLLPCDDYYMETVNFGEKKKKTEQNSGLHALSPYLHSDKRYNSMHCQWLHSHGKITEVNQKRKITFLEKLSRKEKKKKRKTITVSCDW